MKSHRLWRLHCHTTTSNCVKSGIVHKPSLDVNAGDLRTKPQYRKHLMTRNVHRPQQPEAAVCI